MSNTTAVAKAEPKSLLKTFAHKYGVEETNMKNTLKATCFSQGANKPEVTNEQMMALLVVANEYNLNPFTREIYAFPQNGGIVPIVGIDGWLNIINSHPQFDGMEFEEEFDNGKIISCTCKIYRKDRKYPTEVTEYFSECKMNTKPWTDKPVRMLRHKATIQCGRYAFGFSGIYDEDDAAAITKDIGGGDVNRTIDTEAVEVTLPDYPDEKFALDMDDWKVMVLANKKTPEEILNMVSCKYALSDDQVAAINALGKME